MRHALDLARSNGSRRSVAHSRRRTPVTPRIWIGELELSESLTPRPVSRPMELADTDARLLVRLHHQAVGFVSMALDAHPLTPRQVWKAVRVQLAEPLERHLAADGAVLPDDWSVEVARAASCTRAYPSPERLMSVVVCTRDRPEILATCLRHLRQLRHPNVEFIIVDNAPTTEETKHCFRRVVGDDSRFRYVREVGPGLSRARNRGLREATGPHVAFTDDDVRVDSWWLHGLAAGFVTDPAAGCVTGIVPPAELDDEAQLFFDRRYSWAKHHETRVFDLAERADASPLYPYSAGIFGTGANFAVDRQLLLELGGFDEALGAGTPAGGGEDLDAFVRVLTAGRSLVYEPSAIVWHVHRADDLALRRQLHSYGSGLTAFIFKNMMEPQGTRAIASRIPVGARRLARTWHSHEIGGRAPRALVFAEVTGMFAGPFAYLKGRRQVRRTHPIGSR